MNQLSMIPSSWLFATVTIISWGSFLVNAENCEFQTDSIDKTSDIWVITGDPISEYTPADTSIWDVGTNNIDWSASSGYPHGVYLSGLRYPTKYVYKTSTAFPNFIKNERSLEINRNVTFTCSDGEKRRVHFRFHLIDENEPPEFIEYPKEVIHVNLAEADKTTVINKDHPIICRDRDFTDENTNVTVTSDRRKILKIDWNENTDNAKRIGKNFHVHLKLNLENGPIPSGQYNINLFCSDWQFSNSARISINFFRNQ